MRPTFYGLEIAKTGLFISQKAIDVTGHNIANVDTAGYTRQRLSLTSIDPYNATYKMKPLTKGLVGGGVQVQLLEQIRNVYLDRQFRIEQANYSHWATRTTGLGYLESLFDDISGSGISSTIIGLFDAFDDLAHSSSEQELRTVVQQAAITMIASMKSTYDSMVTQHQIQNESVKGVADEINSIASSLVELNAAIYRFEDNDMQKANDLRDKRNLLLDQLSALVDMDYNEDSQGKMTVTIAGEVLVDHTTQNVVEATKIHNPITGATDLWELHLGSAVLDNNKVSGGELKGHLELRDNDTKENPGIPYFIEQLNTLTRALVQEINAIHQKGYTHPNAGVAYTPPVFDPITGKLMPQGINFFDDFGDINDVTAGNLKLSDEVLASVWNIACSTDPIDLSDPENAKAGNQENSLLLAGLIDNTLLSNYLSTGVSSFNGFILSMLAEYTGTTHHSKTRAATLNTTTLSVDNQRLSVSGVSLDEEMTNLIRFQHAYNGASRVITTLDEALEMLINRMGLVGRS